MFLLRKILIKRCKRSTVDTKIISMFYNFTDNMFNCFPIRHIFVLYNVVYVLCIITFSTKIFTKDFKIIIKLSNHEQWIIENKKQTQIQVNR